MQHNVKDILGFTRFIMQRIHEDRCSQVAANLTFTTLLGLVPMITIALTLVSAFPAFSDFLLEIKAFILKNLVPDVAGRLISSYMEQFTQNAARLTTIGIALLAVTAFMLISTIDNAFNTIWRVRQSRQLIQRFMIYWAVLTLGPILIGASISLSSYIVNISQDWVTLIPTTGKHLLKIFPIMLTTLAFSLIYLVVPNRFIQRSYALVGGFIAALMFETVKHLFTTYIANMSTYSLVYGTFASLPLFLIWIYSCWFVVLFGAVMTASLPYWEDNSWKITETPYQKFQDALRVLRALYRSYQQNETVSLKKFKSRVPMALEPLEDLLNCLIDVGLVHRNSDKQYLLIRQPDDIKLRDIYRLFFPVPHADLNIDEETKAVMNEIFQTIDENLKQTLQSIFANSNETEPLQLPNVKIMPVKNETAQSY